MMKHDLRVGETIQIGSTKITLARKSGQIAALIIDAPRDVQVTREPKNKATQEHMARTQAD